MKRKKIRMPLFILIVLFSSTELFAQKNLESWIKECEKDSTVDITVIDNKFPDTKKRDSYIVKVSFKDKPVLLNKMYEAYIKDKPDSYSTSDKRVNGLIVPDRGCFTLIEKDQTVTDIVFDFYYREGVITVTMIKKFDSANKDLDKKRNRHYMGG